MAQRVPHGRNRLGLHVARQGKQSCNAAHRPESIPACLAGRE
jgi:hypothetical protein